MGAPGSGNMRNSQKMPIIDASGTGPAATYTVTQLLQLGNGTVNFAALQGAVKESLGTKGMSGKRLIGADSRATRSVGLMTCASVIYVFGNSYFVYHAGGVNKFV